jgi:alpha-ketoglutarate-dependent taurine dioxygenase
MTRSALSAIAPLSTSFGSVVTKAVSSPQIEPEELVSLLRQSGAVLLRGFELDRDAFVALSDACCSRFSHYVGGGFRFRGFDRVSLGAGGTLLSVTGDTQSFPIPLHGEMYYQRERPDMLWFYCERPALQGGETTVADGRELFRRLSVEARRFFGSANLRYVRELENRDWQVMFQTQSLDDVRSLCDRNEMRLEVHADGSICTEFVDRAVAHDATGAEVFINSALILWEFERAVGAGNVPELSSPGQPITKPPIVVRQEDGSPLPEPLVAEVEQICGEVRVKIPWQRGDVLLVDNSWVLHGRRRASDENREILVRLGYLPAAPPPASSLS